MAEDAQNQGAQQAAATPPPVTAPPVAGGDDQLGIPSGGLHPRAQHFSLDVPPGADLEPEPEPGLGGGAPGGTTEPLPAGTNLPDWVTQEHIELARNYRLSPEQLRYFSSADAFLAAVDEHNRRMLQASMAYGQYPGAGQSPLSGMTPSPQQGQQEPQPQPPASQGQQQTPEYLEDFYYKVNIDKDTYGDELATELGKMSEHYAKQLTALASSVQQLTHWLGQHRAMLEQSMQQSMQDYQRQQWADIQRSIHALGPEYQEVFGNLSDAKPGTPQHQNWMRLYQEMKKLEAGYMATRSPMPSYAELARAALRVAMPDLITNVERNRVVQQAKRRQTGFVPRANQVPPSEEQNSLLRAAKRIDEFRHAHGLR